ncbi:MAG: hypothetical protein Tsb0032_23830 [Kiloniellaceae bacterium]
MLVVSNGAFKCGSTWLFNILMALQKLEWPEAEYLTKGNAKHPAIAARNLGDYLAKGDYESRDVISKNHLEKPEHREMLLARGAVRVFCMTRDSRDVIVSAYYHDMRKKRFDGSFAQYYWEEGRTILPRLMLYRSTWAAPHPQVETTTFEALKSDFAGEVTRIATLLGLSPDAAMIEKVHQETSLGALREKYQDAPSHRTAEADFFRKGETGDWRNHFDDKILADHDRICRKGISPLDRHLLLNRVKQKIRRARA